MATHLRNNASIDLIADVCDAIAAGLESDPTTRHLAHTWQALTGAADKLAYEKRGLERTLRRTRSRLKVADARWDSEIAAFGRAVVDASAGNRSTPLYARFFDKTTPSAAQSFGYEREIAMGKQWVTELGRDPAEPLAKAFTSRLEVATGTLSRAVEEHAASVAAVQPNRTSVALLLDAVNRELDKTEGELLKLFPGERARVASFLLATRTTKSELSEAEKAD